MHVEMSVEETNQNVQAGLCINMESVNRISKLPVVESTINTATKVYSKVKDFNCVTQWTLSTAENTVHKAVEVTRPYAVPVVTHLKDPLEKVDGYVCSGLDYIEEKVPAVKLPPGEMYTGAKDYVTSAVGSGVQGAKTMVEPAVETAIHYMEPALETASAVKDYGVQKIDQILHSKIDEVEEDEYEEEDSKDHECTGSEECEECIKNGKEEKKQK